MPTPTECRRCSDPRHTVALANIEQGRTTRQAAEAAGLHGPSVHRHRRECPPYAARYERAEQKRGKLPPQRGRHREQLAARFRAAMPIIIDAVREGSSRPQAVARANAALELSNEPQEPTGWTEIREATERGWFRDQPTYRAAIVEAEADYQAQAGASR